MTGPAARRVEQHDGFLRVIAPDHHADEFTGARWVRGVYFDPRAA